LKPRPCCSPEPTPTPAEPPDRHPRHWSCPSLLDFIRLFPEI
jgi:hypothetical protein